MDISSMDISMQIVLEQEQAMQEMQQKPEALLPLTPAVFHILLALVGSDRHGYGIMQEVQGYTDGKLRIGPGTLYRSIRQMLAEGLIIELDERPDPELDDQRRRYYRLTNFGQRVLKAETERLEHVLKVARARQRLTDAKATTEGGGH
jgi:DNA-binding PadR family transcriptional regulator